VGEGITSRILVKPKYIPGQKYTALISGSSSFKVIKGAVEIADLGFSATPNSTQVLQFSFSLILDSEYVFEVKVEVRE
jgi:hypothetical protein